VDSTFDDVSFDANAHRHLWTLSEWPITQLGFDVASVRLSAWKLQGSVEIRVGCPFTFRTEADSMLLDPEATTSLSPILSLLGQPLHTITVTSRGVLHLEIGHCDLAVEPHREFEAWEAQGEGVFDGLGYLCRPGGGSPWGQTHSSVRRRRKSTI
jgi:uncharacterized protein DUF6188